MHMVPVHGALCHGDKKIVIIISIIDIIPNMIVYQ